jgi:NitT/TauT family transport system substrate-binding protein
LTRDMIRSGRTLMVLAFVLAITAAACGAGAGPVSNASTQPSAAAPSDPLAPYPSKAGNLPTVKIAQSVPVVSFAPLLIAQRMNFFQYQGVKLEFVQLQSGSTSLQAVTSGSVDLSNGAATEVVTGAGRGLDLQMIQNSAMMTLEFCVSKAWAQQKGVTQSSPLADRVAALKGATIAITGPGASSDLFTRFLLTKYGKLNPDTDTKIVQVGGASAMAGAIDGNQIQAFLQSPPSCGQSKNGMILIKPLDVPEFANFPLAMLYGSKKWLEANKASAKAAATAVSMGNNFILKYPEAALKMLQLDFPQVDPQVLADSLNNNVKPSIKKDGKFDLPMWQSSAQLMIDAKVVTQPVNPAEGVIWTNEYIGDASVK